MNKGKPSRDCWDNFFRAGRNEVFSPLFVGAVVLLAIVGVSLAGWAWWGSRFAVSWKLYTSSSQLNSGSFAHVLAGTTPMTMTLPNNLIEFVGGLYSVDCASPLGHSIKISSGVLATSWTSNGTITTVATCQPGVVNAGFLFRVISPTSIRVIDPQNVVLS